MHLPNPAVVAMGEGVGGLRKKRRWEEEGEVERSTLHNSKRETI